MKEYSTKDIRNVVLIGSAKSGKTTLSEAMLFEGKVIARRGTVEDKNTVSDNEEIEKLNQRSIFATPLYAEFMNTKFNVIDAPGSDDFIGGAVSAFKVVRFIKHLKKFRCQSCHLFFKRLIIFFLFFSISIF